MAKDNDCPGCSDHPEATGLSPTGIHVQHVAMPDEQLTAADLAELQAVMREDTYSPVGNDGARLVAEDARLPATPAHAATSEEFFGVNLDVLTEYHHKETHGTPHQVHTRYVLDGGPFPRPRPVVMFEGDSTRPLGQNFFLGQTPGGQLAGFHFDFDNFGVMAALPGWRVSPPPEDQLAPGDRDQANIGSDRDGRYYIVGGKLDGIPKVDDEGRNLHPHGPPTGQRAPRCIPDHVKPDCRPVRIIQFDFPRYTDADFSTAIHNAEWETSDLVVTRSGLLNHITKITFVQQAKVQLKYVRCTGRTQTCCCDDDCVVYQWGWFCTETTLTKTITRTRELDETSEFWSAVLDLVLEILAALGKGAAGAVGQKAANSVMEALGWD